MTYKDYSWNVAFRDMCKQIGAPLTYLKAIMEDDAEIFVASRKSADAAAASFSKMEMAAPVNGQAGAN